MRSFISRSGPTRSGQVPSKTMQFCIFFINIQNMSNMQNRSRKSIYMELRLLSLYICCQVHIFEYDSECLLAVVPQSEEQRWRRFLFCLHPARAAVAAKQSMPLLQSISLLPAFPAKFCLHCKVQHEPIDSQTISAGSTRHTMTLCSLADFCYLLDFCYV